MRQIKRYAQVLPTLSSDLQLALKHRILQYDNSFTMRKYVHEVLFRETIMAQGTPEQWASWRDRIETLQVIGSFAMTELGNSSFLRGRLSSSFALKKHNFIEYLHLSERVGDAGGV